MLSLLLKILSAAGLITGLAGFVMEARGLSWGRIPPEYTRHVAIGLIVVSLGLGGADFWVSRDQEKKPVGGSQFNFNAPVGGVVNAESIGQVTINAGDPPTVRERKLHNARQAIAADVLNAIGSLDARLSFVDQALSADEHADEIRAAQKRTAPAAEQALAEGYGQLIGSARAASLRQSLNSRPLRVELGGPLMNVLVENGADVSATRYFYDQLVDVLDVSESLVADLESASRPANRQPETQAYYRRLIHLQQARLRNRSSMAHLAGIRVLNGLEVPVPPDASARLATLRHLEPRRLVDDATTERLLAQKVAEAEQMLAERQALIPEAERLLRKSIGEYADMAELRINSEDPWNVVVGKAISLRQLGRTAEAVAAFARYAEMFGPTDPTAERYAATAQQFTVQLPRLGVDGGVYLYQMSASDTGEGGDLQVGDIVTSWGGREVSGMPDFLGAVQASPGGTVRLHYLRRKGSHFERRTTSVVGKGVPGGFMPI